MVPDANVSPLTKAFPNIISIFDDPFAINLFNFSGILASILFMLGFKSRVSGLWIWYIFACYVGRNPLINNPGLSFLGWILIANCFIPSAPSIFSLSSKSSETLKSEWKLPDNLFLVFWIVTSLAYGYSGFTKLGSPSWLDGSAVHEAMYLPLARPSLLRDFMLQLPLPIFMGLTWGSLALELFYGCLLYTSDAADE